MKPVGHKDPGDGSKKPRGGDKKPTIEVKEPDTDGGGYWPDTGGE